MTMTNRSQKLSFVCFVLIINHFIFLYSNEPIISDCVDPTQYACTGFAVYFGNPIYGMNFDYPLEYEVILNIETTAEHKFFNCGFTLGTNFIPVSGMNSEGFFSSTQMLIPSCSGKESEERTQGEMLFWELHYLALSSFSSMKQVNKILAENIIIPSNQVSIHLLMADKHGNAKVIDPIETGNSITTIEEDYIVMTNFPVYSVSYKNYREAEGEGADRFILAHDNILQYKDDFDWEAAMTILEKAALRSGSFLTRCSTVFDPQKNEIYAAIEMDFKHIWKIDLDEGNIQTYLGFEQEKQFNLDIEGISIKELLVED